MMEMIWMRSAVGLEGEVTVATSWHIKIDYRHNCF